MLKCKCGRVTKLNEPTFRIENKISIMIGDKEGSKIVSQEQVCGICK